ncbi:MAG: tetratricopeptide repeat protein [Planctomycetota bacterium]
MLQKEPNDPFLHFALGMEWAKEGRTDQAVSCFDQSVSVDPLYLTAYMQKGQVLAGSGRGVEARNAFEAGIAAAIRAGDDHAREEMQAMIDGLSQPI